MAEISPFRGIRYDPQHAGVPLRDLVAPPYDVISPSEQAELYERDPHNVIRLILGREDDRYSRAAQTFRDWLGDGILTADTAPALYLYRQRFHDPLTGEAVPERLGLVCLLRLQEYESGGVLPHENTLTHAKADRLNLLRATHAQFESIHGLYSDPDRSIQTVLHDLESKERILEQVDDVIGSSHIVETIAEPNVIAEIVRLFAEKTIFIADGHHRYETSLNYRRELAQSGADSQPLSAAADSILITLTAFEDPGLRVLPTHRLVRNVDPAAVSGLADSLRSHFALEPCPLAALVHAVDSAAAKGKVAFGVVLPGGNGLLASLKGTGPDLAKLVPGPQSDSVKCLPVTLLQHLVLSERLGIRTEELAAGGHVGYTRDASEAVAAVAGGAYQAAFLLGRPSVGEVRDVSLAKDKMPQKSTFFYPKLLSGLLMRDLDLG